MRPKKVSDRELLRLSMDVIINDGPMAFTLRRVAKHAKVSPATLIKRFGSREKLLENCISFHISQIAEYVPKEGEVLEDYLELQMRDAKQNNIIQNVSMLAVDMREPALMKLTKSYFNGFKRVLYELIERDSRFKHVENLEGFVLQVEAVFHGAMIQGAFLEKTTIQKNIYKRVSQYVVEAS